MQTTTDHKQLLNNVINLRKRYSLVDKLSARPFNIFTILRAERNERFTHSAFIAELLNPQGSHCQGDIFLKLLLNGIEWADQLNIKLSKAKIKVEQHIGNGFIDIWIDFGNANLCIENKIDARDQKDQLNRYNQHCLNQKKPYKIIYLTLDGHHPEDIKAEQNLDYINWSYSDQIIPWLNLCIKETARLPILRETIHQYQQLLKKLCGILQNENEAMELNELLKKDVEHFEAASNIHEQFKRARFEVNYTFWDEVRMYFLEKYNEVFEVEFSFNENESYPHIIIGHKSLDDWYACLCIEWLHRNTYYGIYSYGYGDRSTAEKKIIDQYDELCFPGFKSSEYFFSYKYYNNIDFSSIDTSHQIFLPTEKRDLLHQITEPVDGLIEQYGNRILEINKEIYLKLHPVIPEL